MSSYSLVSSHREMVFDARRNAHYLQAMRGVIGPESVVLDLGAGVGVLGLEAARCGARKVYCVDPSPVVRLAGEIAVANGLGDRIEVIQANIEDVILPESVDLILSVFTGNFLLEEDLLPLLFIARDRFLAPGGQMLPDLAEMQVAPVSLPDFYDAHVNRWRDRDGEIDYGTARKYAVNSTYTDHGDRFAAVALGPSAHLSSLDLAAATRAECRAVAELQFHEAGICHGFIGWFRMRLGTQWLSTSPWTEPVHWSQMFFPLEEPLTVQSGQSATVEVTRPAYGDWSWTWESAGRRELHSTFLAAPPDIDRLRKSADGYCPELSPRGQFVRDLLAALDGERTVKALEEAFLPRSRGLFVNDADARAFIRQLLQRNG